jgi:hypothetical protein
MDRRVADPAVSFLVSAEAPEAANARRITNSAGVYKRAWNCS